MAGQVEMKCSIGDSPTSPPGVVVMTRRAIMPLTFPKKSAIQPCAFMAHVRAARTLELATMTLQHLRMMDHATTIASAARMLRLATTAPQRSRTTARATTIALAAPMLARAISALRQVRMTAPAVTAIVWRCTCSTVSAMDGKAAFGNFPLQIVRTTCSLKAA